MRAIIRVIFEYKFRDFCALTKAIVQFEPNCLKIGSWVFFVLPLSFLVVSLQKFSGQEGRGAKVSGKS